MDHYRYGRKKEYQVAATIKRKFGFQKVEISPGSRGEYDILAQSGRKKWMIQVKSTRDVDISPSRLKKEDEIKLKRVAKKTNAKPIVALVSRNQVHIENLDDGKVHLHDKLHKLRKNSLY
jgi:Holliday junction resolvase